jgi:glycosyltransferase involved in cell wall biosynthesis
MRGTSLAQMSIVPFARPLPIAIVLHSFSPGGTERQMTELVRRLDPARWEVHLACFQTDGAWFGRAAERAASVASFPIKSFKDPATFAQMRAFAAWCREKRIALVHTSELYTNICFLPGAAMARVPVRIGSRREIVAGKTIGQLALQRLAYTCAHHIVANAEAVATRLTREGVRARRITVVPNGLDHGRFAPRLVSTAPRRRVAMVANLRPEKGHDLLIDASVSVLAEFPDARFDIIGDGTERQRVEAYARARGVAHAFTFHGHCEDVPSRLAAADVFVLPSRSEAFPNAVLEAMAAGLPVVASAVGGILEVVRHGDTGLLVRSGDAGALASQIRSLMADEPLAARLAARGVALVQSRYSFDRMVAALDELYVTELTRRAPVTVPESRLASL